LQPNLSSEFFETSWRQLFPQKTNADGQMRKALVLIVSKQTNYGK
jgi:hypothetical protein